MCSLLASRCRLERTVRRKQAYSTLNCPERLGLNGGQGIQQLLEFARSRLWESNPRPTHYETDVLPAHTPLIQKTEAVANDQGLTTAGLNERSGAFRGPLILTIRIN